MGRILTKRVILPVSNFRRSRGKSTRAVYEHYQAGLKFRRSSKNWGTEQKADWILDSLRRTVRNAYSKTRFYRERFKECGFDPTAEFSFEDFGRVPVLDRDHIHRFGNELISEGVSKLDRIRNSTGGSTGKPTQIWMGPEERGWNESGIEHSLERIGIPAGSRVAYFWGHHLDPQLEPTFPERLRAWALNFRFFDCFRLSPEIFDAYHRQLERFSPDCIVAYASALGQFAGYLKGRGIRPVNYPRTCFVTGAEKLYPTQRNVIEEVFGKNKPIHERYGGRDFGPAAIQLKPLQELDLTVDWSWCLVEPETVEPDSPILVTKLHADAMPLIRYKVGDIGHFLNDASPGTPVFSLKEVIGREMDGVVKSDGRWLHGAQFPHMIKDFPVREFMLIQESDLSIEMKIVRDDGFRDLDHRKILETIRSNTGDLPLKISFVEEIERGSANKWRPVVSKANRYQQNG